MNPRPSMSSIRRVFFSPIDQKRIETVREEHLRKINELNIINIR
jgi:hypothetical protein